MVMVYDTYGNVQRIGMEELAGIIARVTGQSVEGVRETLERAR